MIDGLGGRLPPIAVRPAATAAPVAEATKVKTATPDVSRLATAVRDMAASPPVDSAKVDRLRTAITQGTYAVQPDAIAERMIATDLRRG